MTDKPAIKVGDFVGSKKVVAVAEAGYYAAPISYTSKQTMYHAAEFIRTG